MWITQKFWWPANFLAFNLNEMEEKAGSLWWLGGKWGGCTWWPVGISGWLWPGSSVCTCICVRARVWKKKMHASCAGVWVSVFIIIVVFWIPACRSLYEPILHQPQRFQCKLHLLQPAPGELGVTHSDSSMACTSKTKQKPGLSDSP